MKRFAALYASLDESTRTTAKVAALTDYFRNATAADAAWAIAFLIGRKPRQVVGSRLLREWAAEASAIPLWLFEESYHAVGDLAETIALLLPASDPGDLIDRPLAEWVEQHLLPLAALEESGKKRQLLHYWQSMTIPERFIWNKIITGAFRVGVSQNLVTQALSKLTGLEAAVLAHRLMGDWRPTPEFYLNLIQPEAKAGDPRQLYPFIWPIRWNSRWKCWARPRNGRLSGSGTGFDRN